MKNILSSRVTIWGVFIVYVLYTYLTWQIYEANRIEPPAIIYILSLLLLVVFLVVCVFRCKALNWSGWRVMALFIPIVGVFLLVFLLFKKPIVGSGIVNEFASS